MIYIMLPTLSANLSLDHSWMFPPLLEDILLLSFEQSRVPIYPPCHYQCLTSQGTLANGNYSPYSNGHTYTSSRPQSPQVSFLSSTHHLNPHVSGSFIGRDESSNVPASHPRGQGQVKTRHIVKHHVITIKHQTYCLHEQALLVIASLYFFLAFPFIALYSSSGFFAIHNFFRYFHLLLNWLRPLDPRAIKYASRSGRALKIIHNYPACTKSSCFVSQAMSSFIDTRVSVITKNHLGYNFFVALRVMSLVKGLYHHLIVSVIRTFLIASSYCQLVEISHCPPHIVSLLKPRSLEQRARMNVGWLDSSLSIMEQVIC